MRSKKAILKSFAFLLVSFKSPVLLAEVNHLDNERNVTEFDERNFESLDKDFLTLSFSKSKSEISDDQRIDLKNYVKSISRDGSVQKFVVVSWSDREYPAGVNEELSDFDKKIADDRRFEVSRILREFGESGVESVSMAVHPSWLSKVFGTQEAIIKGETNDLDQDYQSMAIARISNEVRSRGGPGKVVVVAIHWH